jgi:glycerophosphoryl diester phosphodiesterase
MPSAAPLARPTFDVQGHRGARGLAPENTLPAFRRALALGVTTLELDAVVSADGEVVVSHDPWMSSLFCSLPDGAPVPPGEEERHRIYAMPYAEVARYDCGRRGHPLFPRQEAQPAVKPRLRDVFAFAEAYARERGRPLPFYNVETKSWPDGDGRLHPAPEAFVEELWGVVEAAGVAERLTLQSFDVRTLQVARRRRLPVRLALLVEEAGQDPEVALQDGLVTLGFTPDVYSPGYRLVTGSVVGEVHARGMAVLPWTVNDPEDMRRLRALGVDGLITDYPDVAVPLLLRVA